MPQRFDHVGALPSVSARRTSPPVLAGAMEWNPGMYFRGRRFPAALPPVFNYPSSVIVNRGSGHAFQS
jgi:hypothetical protein